MRQNHPNESLQDLCGLFGVTRQAYYDAQEHEKRTSAAHAVVLGLVQEFRTHIPMLGTRKLHHLILDELSKHNIKIDRDKLFDLLRFPGLLVRRRRRATSTANSHHWLKKYPNLKIGIVVNAPEQLWVSDITYLRTQNEFRYLNLITDAYSRKIIGYYLSESLAASGPLQALRFYL